MYLMLITKTFSLGVIAVNIIPAQTFLLEYSGTFQGDGGESLFEMHHENGSGCYVYFLSLKGKSSGNISCNINISLMLP